MLRHGHGTRHEIYLFIKSGVIYSHFHEPEGSFQLWWDGVPLCDEYGIKSAKGVAEARSHNCIELPGDLLGYNKGDISTFVATDTFDYLIIEAPMRLAYLPAGAPPWGFQGEVGPAAWLRRHVLFVRPLYLYFYDELTCPHPTKYHLNVKADACTQRGSHVHYQGRLGVDLEFLALNLGARRIVHGEFDVQERLDSPSRRYTFQASAPPRFYHQLQLTIEGGPNQDYATVLVPHKPALSVSVNEDAVTGGARITAGTQADRAMLFPTTVDIHTPEIIYRGQAGAIQQNSDALRLLQAKGSEIGIPEELVILGDGPFHGKLAGDGTLAISTSGTGRWLTIRGRQFSEAFCNDRPHGLARAAAGALMVYVPPGSCNVLLR